MAGSNVGIFGGRLRAVVCAVGWDECGYSYAWSLESSGGRADALRLLQRGLPKSGLFTILCYLHQLCGKDWILAFSKVDRRNNGVADRLAKLASAATFDVVTFDEPPSEVVLDVGGTL
ncbi:hypothetical protein V6N12_045693 [Hibiscus sabdariffa]|uniref:RNase H type-1 domain-containing protein n=1 Tax=Hibiscus sabdariffa TaxID=183260 RepID=A0ABR2G3I0_9ROSI